MDWSKLFATQKKLDDYIEKNNSLQNKDLFDEKVLALIVELGELANETRSFKFWSKNKTLDKLAILEEYIDGVHFILSLGLEKNYTFEGGPSPVEGRSISEQFLLLYELIISFKNNPSEENYHTLFSNYLTLGNLLQLTAEQLQEAYFEKNEVNFKRQDTGY